METAYFDRFTIDLTRDDAFYGCHPGDCSESIETLYTVKYIAKQLDALDPTDVHDELASYGAWDDDQLSDTYANLFRILWLACGQIYDDCQTDQAADEEH